MRQKKPLNDISQLVLDHYTSVYRYAFRLTGNAADAEDLTQQVFLTAQQKIGQIREAQKARCWLFTILRNCFLKSCKKRLTLIHYPRLKEQPIPATVPDDLAIDGPMLQQALDALPPKYRVVLGMFYYEDCSYRQIAEALKLPIGTVMSRLARAKRALRAKLDDLLAEGESQSRVEPVRKS